MIKIKNWDKFQHFKDRRPPWVKVYRELLDSVDWFELSGDDAKFLVSCWLLGSEDEKLQGYLPDIKTISWRLRISEHEVKQRVKRLNAFLISDLYQDDAPETETETETETYYLSGKQEIPGNGRTDIARRILDFLNAKSGRRYKQTQANLDFIIARLKEGYTEQEIRQVTAMKIREWRDTDMDKFIRPATLYNRQKFNQYAGELKQTEDNDNVRD